MSASNARGPVVLAVTPTVVYVGGYGSYQDYLGTTQVNNNAYVGFVARYSP